jgi:hypothetical protein
MTFSEVTDNLGGQWDAWFLLSPAIAIASIRVLNKLRFIGAGVLWFCAGVVSSSLFQFRFPQTETFIIDDNHALGVLTAIGFILNSTSNGITSHIGGRVTLRLIGLVVMFPLHSIIQTQGIPRIWYFHDVVYGEVMAPFDQLLMMAHKDPTRSALAWSLAWPIAAIIYVSSVYALDTVIVGLRKSVMNRKRMSANTTKLISIAIMLILCFFGFYLLDILKGIAWLLFLIISYPVLVSFVSSVLDGRSMTPKELGDMYRSSLQSLPVIKELIRESKQEQQEQQDKRT